MIDDDDNYYDATAILPPKNRDGKDYFTRAPLYMQKVSMPATNPNFIQVGMIGYRDSGETKAIFMRRTKELEEGEKKMFGNLAKAIAPDVLRMAAVSAAPREQLEEYIAAQKASRDKKAAQAKRKYEKELHQIDSEYTQSVKYAERRLSQISDIK